MFPIKKLNLTSQSKVKKFFFSLFSSSILFNCCHWNWWNMKYRNYAHRSLNILHLAKESIEYVSRNKKWILIQVNDESKWCEHRNIFCTPNDQANFQPLRLLWLMMCLKIRTKQCPIICTTSTTTTRFRKMFLFS